MNNQIMDLMSKPQVIFGGIILLLAVITFFVVRKAPPVKMGYQRDQERSDALKK